MRTVRTSVNCSLSNNRDNFLSIVRVINHEYIVVERGRNMSIFNKNKKKEFDYRKTCEYFQQNREIKKENFLKCPEWLEPEYDYDGTYLYEPDELYMLFDPMLQMKFFKEGKVALGALVQANELLFKRGSDNCPANYIYTRDPYYTEHTEEFHALAMDLFQTKGEAGFIPSIQKLADILADEEECTYCYKLPRNVTEGREVYFTTIMVDRDHLPGKKLAEGLKPMLILPYSKPDAMILPYWYWRV